ncbi:hypothetical protein M5K25_015534 [Dendrobium thyrsiflorum]|uniref:Uncharacterized protein n=1 Tax=Dendrobium thyrsiflorum TaxID=117978 RepID=A0ABD0URC3_DENTH
MAEYFVLNTGAMIPSVGLGTWQAEPGGVGAAVVAAVKTIFGIQETGRSSEAKHEGLTIEGQFSGAEEGTTETLEMGKILWVKSGAHGEGIRSDLAGKGTRRRRSVAARAANPSRAKPANPRSNLAEGSFGC